MKSPDFEIAVEEMMALSGLPKAKRDFYVRRAVELNHVEVKRKLKRTAKTKSMDGKGMEDLGRNSLEGHEVS